MPFEAFSTDELCTVCYGLSGVQWVERKHRVAVLRAMQKVLGAEPDWRYRHAILSRGNLRVFFNAASVASTAKADFKTWHLDGDGWGRTWDSEPQRLAEAEHAAAEHTIMRHGTDEQCRQLAERSAAEHQLSMAKLRVAVMVSKSPVSVLVGASRMMSGELLAVAEKARALMVENDPDAIRDGLREIAAKLDELVRNTQDPMGFVEQQLA